MRKILPAVLLLNLILTGCQAQKPGYSNQLVNETSPYLLQHAHNPVNWYPWGEAALEKAREEDKLLIVSIGYAACHWCHVMERESFEDTAVARVMNEHFVSVKVDREERPDIDAVYMDACQLASGEACGWPLNVFALPDGRPVWAGTYFPKKRWLQMLDYFIKLYAESPEKLRAYAERLTAGIQPEEALFAPEDAELAFSTEALQPSLDAFKQTLDPERGGRRGAPKFPIPNAQELLLNWYYRTGDQEALELVRTTLDAMGSKGLYDHIGGGFARYSTDENWRVPHFEKMLYDNAQLVSLYSKAYAVTKNEDYRRKTEETLAFISREMSDEKGGFYSSLDADSDGEEGKFYVWTREEVEAALPDDLPLQDAFLAYYNITEYGNWEAGKNILYSDQALKDFASQKDIAPEELRRAFAEIREILFREREKRTRPGLDNKVITAWNGLMLKGYLDAYRYLGDPAYLERARANADFLTGTMQESTGRLHRTYNRGQAKINGFLDDYAFLADALISLYEVTFEEEWLYRADTLVQYAIEHFYAEQTRLFNYTSKDDPPLVARKLELSDNVMPGSNSAMARVLFKLGTLMYKEAYLEMARSMVVRVSRQALDPDLAGFYTNWLQLYLNLAATPYEVAIVGEDCARLRREFQRMYLPEAFFLGGSEEGNLELLQDKLQSGETYIYVCRNKVCKFPVQEVAEARKLMQP